MFPAYFCVDKRQKIFKLGLSLIRPSYIEDKNGLTTSYI